MNYSIQPVVLQFKQPAGTSRGVYRERKLWYVHLYDNAFHGIGECAPLYDLSCDYRDDMQDIIDSACKYYVSHRFIDYEGLKNYPSVLFALETAVLSLEGSRKGNALKFYDNSFTRNETGITFNGLVWMGSYEEMSERVEQKLSQGFKCIKIKIGAIEIEKELLLLKKLRERYSEEEIQIRVDANGGFTPEKAPTILKTLASMQIHSIEQPIRQGQWKEMAFLCKQSPIPIALDEELIGINDLKKKQELLDNIQPQYIILKPTLHGGLSGCEEWIREAQKRNIGYWVTSALESNVGLNAIAQWTAQIGSTKMPQGLGTGSLFKTNFDATDLETVSDKLWFNSAKQREFTNRTNEFVNEWKSATSCITAYTSGSTGRPKPINLEKGKMVASAQKTLNFLKLMKGDSALLCLPLEYIAGKMLVVRCLVGALRLIITAPSSRPFRTLLSPPDFAAITPMQAVETLKHSHDTMIMKGTGQIIIGGGAIPTDLECKLRDFPNNVWSTYGMTETLSHIAMRKLNGKGATPYYTPLDGVKVSLTNDGRLKIDAPYVCEQTLITNDLAEIRPDGTFIITGRKDNVVCSGGIKLQIEDLERRLQGVFDFPFILTSVKDQLLGEALVMLYRSESSKEDLKHLCTKVLNRYEIPKHYLRVTDLPTTSTGKIARLEAKRLAADILKNV